MRQQPELCFRHCENAYFLARYIRDLVNKVGRFLRRPTSGPRQLSAHVGDALLGIHLSRGRQYAQRFAENEIDISVLRHLSDQDLKDIGVPLGHRLKMLAAIGELAGAALAPPEPATATEPKPQDTAGPVRLRQGYKIVGQKVVALTTRPAANVLFPLPDGPASARPFPPRPSAAPWINANHCRLGRVRSSTATNSAPITSAGSTVRIVSRPSSTSTLSPIGPVLISMRARGTAAGVSRWANSI